MAARKTDCHRTRRPGSCQEAASYGVRRLPRVTLRSSSSASGLGKPGAGFEKKAEAGRGAGANTGSMWGSGDDLSRMKYGEEGSEPRRSPFYGYDYVCVK